MPRSTAPPITGLTPTTGAGVERSAARIPGTARIAPTETTGLEGATTTRSAVPMASSASGVGEADSAPIWTKPEAGSCALCRTHHSWKWIAREPVADPPASPAPAPPSAADGSVTTTCVSHRSSVTGSRRTPGDQRVQSASVTSVRR